MAFCASCGAELKEGTGFCGSCGAPAGAAVGGAPGAVAPAATAGGLSPNVAGALAYVTIIPAILFLVMEPYNKDKFIRFHSFQCLFLAVGAFALSVVLGIFTVIPIIGWIAGLVLFPLFGLAVFVVVLFLMYKAYNNQKWELPVIGKIALQQAG